MYKRWKLIVDNIPIVAWIGNADGDNLPTKAHVYGVTKEDYDIAENNGGVHTWKCLNHNIALVIDKYMPL